MDEERQSDTIIFADDEPATRTLMKRQLEKAGYTVVACADGEAALDAVKAAGHGIVIADWNMPKLKGLELCRAVRELSEMEALGVVYFIVLTAHSERGRVLEAFDAGADDFLAKPCDIQELVARIRVGQRILKLQQDFLRGQIEIHKANAAMAGLNRKLERLANTDSLTGLSNRRHAFERIHECWALAERTKKPLGCIMLDIDRFKKVNDTYGHKAGDAALVNTAGVISQQTRLYDVCGRIGGEEFLIVCPQADRAGTLALAERMRVAVEKSVIRDGSLEFGVTISIGVAQKLPRHATPEDLIAEADRLLYSAKQNGRNQIWYTDDDGVEHAAQQHTASTGAAQPVG